MENEEDDTESKYFDEETMVAMSMDIGVEQASFWRFNQLAKYKMEVLVDEISSSLEHGKGKCDENHDMVKEMEDYMDGPSHFLELN